MGSLSTRVDGEFGFSLQQGRHSKPLSPADENLGAVSVVDEILEDIRSTHEHNPGAALTAAVRLVEFLTSAVDAASTNAAPTGSRGCLAPWQAHKVDLYLRSHLDRPLQSSELADQTSLSVSHFGRAFKETFGETPHEYLIHVRLDRAKLLMLTTSKSLCQIALSCGMADQAHFSKLFRRSTGASPSSWRRLRSKGPGET